jgi:ribosomal protein L11 methyltransferase
MNSPVLWQISVQSPTQHEPVVSQVLAHLFQLPVSSYLAVSPPIATTSVYSTHPLPSQKGVAAHVRATLAQLRPPIPCRVSVRRLPSRDWTSFWKRHFKPISIGRQLLVLPPWIQNRPQPGLKVVVLNPGLSFGTGHHPTTAFCLRQLVILRRRMPRPSLLDLGSGSGILAIAGAKLGYRPVQAIDSDPVAARVALSNSRRNRVDHRIQISRMDLKKVPLRPETRFDVVCANLTSDLLIAEGRRIAGQLQPSGYVVLAGILNREFASIQRHFTSLGFKLLTQQSKGEWHSGLFRSLT